MRRVNVLFDVFNFWKFSVCGGIAVLGKFLRDTIFSPRYSLGEKRRFTPQSPLTLRFCFVNQPLANARLNGSNRSAIAPSFRNGGETRAITLVGRRAMIPQTLTPNACIRSIPVSPT